jgi:uncharacterized membrane protein
MESRNPKLDAEAHSSGASSRLPPIFSAKLYPHRSLGQRGFVILMSFITVICLAIGGFFYSIGAWPVIGFLGLDVLAIYIAFRINYRSARAIEEISISRQEMRILKTSASGHCKTYAFNPVWTRFHIRRHDEIGITSMEILSRKMHLRIGDFLNPVDRESFAREFGAALAIAKR